VGVEFSGDLADDRQSDSDTGAAFGPLVHGDMIEQKLAMHTARRIVFVAPVLGLVFGLFSGVGGGVAAVVGSMIVALNFVLSGAIMSRSARISLSLYHAAALFGFVVRLGLIMIMMFALAAVTSIDKTALGISVVVSYFALLTWEAIAVTKGAEKELEWSN
jgi:hypothetical protein